MNPICPYCPDGVEMVPVRESVGMMRGHDWLQCPKCASRGPEIRTDNGDWEGKQAAAISAALHRYTKQNRALTLDDLIGRAALLVDIERDIEISGCANHEREIMDCIRYAPNVDAVAVVWCVECRWSVPKPGEFGTCEGMHCMVLNRTMDFVDYCSYGKRKEAADV